VLLYTRIQKRTGLPEGGGAYKKGKNEETGGGGGDKGEKGGQELMYIK